MTGEDARWSDHQNAAVFFEVNNSASP
jgi:hypothetical protein